MGAVAVISEGGDGTSGGRCCTQTTEETLPADPVREVDIQIAEAMALTTDHLGWSIRVPNGLFGRMRQGQSPYECLFRDAHVLYEDELDEDEIRCRSCGLRAPSWVLERIKEWRAGSSV